jgi:hypothetical protein
MADKEPQSHSEEVACSTQLDAGRRWLVAVVAEDECTAGTLRPIPIRITVKRTLLGLAGTLSCLRCLDALLLTRFQIEGVALDVLDYVFGQHLALETFECAL